MGYNYHLLESFLNGIVVATTAGILPPVRVVPLVGDPDKGRERAVEIPCLKYQEYTCL